MTGIDWDGWTIALISLVAAAVGWIIGWLEDVVKDRRNRRRGR